MVAIFYLINILVDQEEAKISEQKKEEMLTPEV